MSAPIPPAKVWPDAGEIRASQRLWVAIALSPRLEVCEALLADLPVPVRRLDTSWVRALKLVGDVELDDKLVLRVNAYGPLHGMRAGEPA